MFFGLFRKTPEQVAEEAARSSGSFSVDPHLLIQAQNAGLDVDTLTKLIEAFGALMVAMIKLYVLIYGNKANQ